MAMLNWRGRSGRLAFLVGSAAAGAVVGGLFMGILIFLFSSRPAAIRVSGSAWEWAILAGLGCVVALCLFVHVVLGIRRLHDMDRTGWHMAWLIGCMLAAGFADDVHPSLGPAMSLVVMLGEVWLLLAPGTRGANRFGPPPG
jgi:uncharacterized membrane protein YhaH (DUF805 family)